MAQAAYPTMVDLGAWLQDAGFTTAVVANLDLTTAAASGVASFERAVGRRMLATSQTREFDLPRHLRGVLDLRDDLAAVTTVTVRGTAQVLGTDYRLREPNAADRGVPYWALQFARRFYVLESYPQPLWDQIAVAGTWGYGATIPDDAWLGMLAAAGLALFPYLAQAQARGLEMWSQADVTERYGSDPLGSFRKNWDMQLNGSPELAGKPGGGGVVGRYRRVALGAGTGHY